MMKKVNQTMESTVSPVEALNIIVQTNLSKESYLFLRETHRQKQCYMYLPYEQVLYEKKKCYPEGVDVSEFVAKISLQNIMDHTAKRLVLAHQATLDICLNNYSINVDEQRKPHLELISKYVIDGSGDQALYCIKYDQQVQSDISETSIVSSFICLIRLILKDTSKILWQNPAPLSAYYCRPVKLSIRKETADNTRQEISELQAAIENLVPTATEKAEIQHKLLLTMVNGKVCQALTHTPAASSYI